MNKNNTKINNYNSLDITKFIFAILIMCAHTASSLTVFPFHIDIFFSLYIFGVPFFFSCSGFLFFNKIISITNKKNINERLKHLSRRIILMYISWSLIYFIFILLNWFINGADKTDILVYIHKCLVFSTYPTIWFLPALLIASWITCLLLRNLSVCTVFFICIITYLFGTSLYSYTPVFSRFSMFNNFNEIYKTLFITSRNGIFNGFPFFFVGFLVAYQKKRIHFKIDFLLSCFFFFLTIIEVFFIKYKIKGFSVDFAISLLPFTYFFLKTLLEIKLPDRKIYKSMRDYSMLIFLSQRIFISAIPALISNVILIKLTNSSLLTLIYVILGTFLLSFLIINYRSKYKCLKFLS